MNARALRPVACFEGACSRFGGHPCSAMLTCTRPPAVRAQVGLGGLGAGILYKAAIGESRRQLPVPPAAADERVSARMPMGVPQACRGCHL